MSKTGVHPPDDLVETVKGRDIPVSAIRMITTRLGIG
jgi:hypothetical protein